MNAPTFEILTQWLGQAMNQTLHGRHGQLSLHDEQGREQLRLEALPSGGAALFAPIDAGRTWLDAPQRGVLSLHLLQLGGDLDLLGEHRIAVGAQGDCLLVRPRLRCADGDELMTLCDETLALADELGQALASLRQELDTEAAGDAPIAAQAETNSLSHYTRQTL